MGFNEFLGFLIVLFVFLFPLLRRILVDKKRKQQAPSPEESELEQEEPELIETTPEPITKPKSLPITPITYRSLPQDFEFHSRLEKKRKKPEVQKTKLSLEELARTKKPLHAFVILSEVYGPPKSMQ